MRQLMCGHPERRSFTPSPCLGKMPIFSIFLNAPCPHPLLPELPKSRNISLRVKGVYFLLLHCCPQSCPRQGHPTSQFARIFLFWLYHLKPTPLSFLGEYGRALSHLDRVLQIFILKVLFATEFGYMQVIDFIEIEKWLQKDRRIRALEETLLRRKL